MASEGVDINRALQALAERLRFGNAPRTILLVGGGSALNVLGLVRRPTKDVDVIAVGNEARGTLNFTSAQPLPEYLMTAIQQTADDLGLPRNWMNAGPASLMDFGLPDGFLARAIKRDYEESLTVFFLGREDQIPLKLYAATDHGGGRHLVDLMALRPTESELIQAARWAMIHDPSVEFKWSLRHLLTEMGFGNVADKL